MTDPIEHLLFEHLKRFQSSLERIERKIDELIVRVGHLEGGQAGLRRDFAHADENAAAMSVRMDHINQRIERIEKRLELA